jgi:hypothetical protein
VINDLTIEEQKKARNFDLDHDGILDEAELAMMRYDVDGDGNLTAAEVHAIIADLLREEKSISNMRKVIIGLTCFVFILALSNLGTSIASALLVKETTADKTTAEMRIVGTSDVMGTQSSAETFEALEMDTETRRARRAMVVESLQADPFGEHVHRRLANNKNKPCTGKKCDSDIAFDVNRMKQKDVEDLKSKCEQGRVVNIKRSFPGDSKDSKNLCRSGTSIVVKELKSVKGPKKGKGKNKPKGFGMTVRSVGIETNFDCDGNDCLLSGSNLLNAHGEPCNLNHGSDDCESGLVCIQNKNDKTSGTCSSFWDDEVWYVDWDNHKCVQSCEGYEGNCGGVAGKWDEIFATHTLCCDTHLSYLEGGYNQCVPDFDFYLGRGRDCTDNAAMCKGRYQCKKSAVNGSDRMYCV